MLHLIIQNNYTIKQNLSLLDAALVLMYEPEDK